MASPSSSAPLPPIPPKISRARSLPTARKFAVTVFFTTLHYLGLIAGLTALVYFFRGPSEQASWFLLGGIAFSVITWFIAFLLRRSTCCPLCKGTPLINSGALAHARAKRLPPFNHGVTATLSILVTQKFRCMYCGSDFDLLKTPSRPLHSMEESSD